MSNKEYFLFNVLFVALLLCLFIIPTFLDGSESLVSCQVLESTGKECKSCGLTRDFISFTHLDFRSPLNSQSIFVFLWFLFQLIGRAILAMISSSITPKLIKYDLYISVFTGILVFLPFWI